METLATILPYAGAALAAVLLVVGGRGLRAARRNRERVRHERRLRLRALLKEAGVDPDASERAAFRVDMEDRAA